MLFGHGNDLTVAQLQGMTGWSWPSPRAWRPGRPGIAGRPGSGC